MSNIVLCSDGTGNSTIKDRGTNVHKLYEAVDIERAAGKARQIVFYDDGVGTGSMKFMRMFGGAFGYGFARNLRDLYTDLARVYEAGDAIFLFGFSRGAYTVRGLAGLIATCGIVRGSSCSEPDLRRAVSAAYKVYRLGYRPDTEANREETRRRAEAFRKEYGVYEPGDPVRIRFIGVWDTVGAVGFPDGTWPKRLLWMLSRYRVPWFKNYYLSHIVDQACHALAIDDERRTFHPELWDARIPPDSRVAERLRVPGRDGTPRDGRLEQVWFAGAHSNVGGGYVKHGMSLVTLHWMMRRAEAAGLRLSPLDKQMFSERENPHDHLYDSRRGLGASYRYRPRELGGICAERGIDAPRVDVSAIDRVAFRTEGYAPGNIPPGCEIVGDDVDPAVLKKLEVTVNTTLAAGLPLDSVRGFVAIRKIGYWISLLTTLALAGWLICRSARTQDWSSTAAALVSVSGVGGLMWDLFTAIPLPVLILVFIIAGSWYTTLRARRRMHDRFADVWRTSVKDLRR